ncbi:hypothetical protein C8R43DRAFT_959534 [Mycena crocata]|nr:hypothetical protein C8R43DRAFT_959534 [Mycena crocata]
MRLTLPGMDNLWSNSSLQALGIVVQTGHQGGVCTHPDPEPIDEITISSADRQGLMKIHICPCRCRIEKIRRRRLQEEREVTLEELRRTELQVYNYLTWKRLSKFLMKLLVKLKTVIEAGHNRVASFATVMADRDRAWDPTEWNAGMQSLLDDYSDLGYSSDEELLDQPWQERPIPCYGSTFDGETAERQWAFLNLVCSPREMRPGPRQTSIENMADVFRQRVLRQVAELDAFPSVSPISLQPKIKLFSDEHSEIGVDIKSESDVDMKSEAGSAGGPKQPQAHGEVGRLAPVRRHLLLTTRAGREDDIVGQHDLALTCPACPAPAVG